MTDKALFSSNDDAIADVDESGVVTAKRPGETAMMVRYLGQVAVSRVAVLPPWKLARYPRAAQSTTTSTSWCRPSSRSCAMVPSDLCTDEEFIRRATLDTCGIIPTPDEVRAFVADPLAEQAGEADRQASGPPGVRRSLDAEVERPLCGTTRA